MAWGVAGNIRGPQGVQGIKGDTGAQGAAGPVGPAGLTWRGPWSSSNSYAMNDHVTWGGSSYYATAAKAAGSPPPTGTSADAGVDDGAVNAGWAILTLQGAQGIQGIKGDTGQQGVAGAAGAAGATGTRGSQWYTGVGAPGTIAGAIPGDKYLDTSNGDVYNLT